jgi:hypothetical protein
MESHEVLKEAFDSPTASPKEIASELGVSLSLVYKWAQPPEGQGSGSRNPLDRVDELVKATGSTALLSNASPITCWMFAMLCCSGLCSSTTSC